MDSPLPITNELLLTPGDIASRLSLPQHKVDYFIKSRSISHVQRAGAIRLFDKNAFARIRAGLQAMVQNAKDVTLTEKRT